MQLGLHVFKLLCKQIGSLPRYANDHLICMRAPNLRLGPTSGAKININPLDYSE